MQRGDWRPATVSWAAHVCAVPPMLFAVLFDQGIKPEPFHECPVVLCLCAPVHRALGESVAADDRFVGAEVLGAPVGA